MTFRGKNRGTDHPFLKHEVIKHARRIYLAQKENEHNRVETKNISHWGLPSAAFAGRMILTRKKANGGGQPFEHSSVVRF
jgi:hypothetical protein